MILSSIPQRCWTVWRWAAPLRAHRLSHRHVPPRHVIQNHAARHIVRHAHHVALAKWVGKIVCVGAGVAFGGLGVWGVAAPPASPYSLPSVIAGGIPAGIAGPFGQAFGQLFGGGFAGGGFGGTGFHGGSGGQQGGCFVGGGGAIPSPRAELSPVVPVGRQSGAAPARPINTPEPASVWVLMVGLTAVIGLSLRRKRGR